jgi:nitrilase
MRIAIIQRAPVFLNRERTIALAVASVEEAVAGGASLVVFPEAFISGYPAWIWRLRPGSDMDLAERLHLAMLESAVTLNSKQLEPLFQVALQNQVTVICGLNERDGDGSRGTLYNTVVTIGPAGTLLNRHRKLMPTNPERMVWGWGDASGLRSVDSPLGRLGALICWESYMPLVRYALYAQGLDIYVAPTYDAGDRWIATMQHIAREGGCYVLGSGLAFKGADLPVDMPGRDRLYQSLDEWVNAGDSVVVAPNGKIVAGPLRDQQGVLYGELDPELIARARRTLDTVGHYARPDLFQLQVTMAKAAPVIYGDERSSASGSHIRSSRS